MQPTLRNLVASVLASGVDWLVGRLKGKSTLILRRVLGVLTRPTYHEHARTQIHGPKTANEQASLTDKIFVVPQLFCNHRSVFTVLFCPLLYVSCRKTTERYHTTDRSIDRSTLTEHPPPPVTTTMEPHGTNSKDTTTTAVNDGSSTGAVNVMGAARPKEFDMLSLTTATENTTISLKLDIQKTLRRDGAVILSNIHKSSKDYYCGCDGVTEHKTNVCSCSWSDIAANVPALIFDEQELLLLRGQEGSRHGHRADPVHVEHSQIGLDGASLLPHSDGYIWGDHYPDLVVLVCEQPAAETSDMIDKVRNDGSNYLIDGLNVVKRLDDETRQLLETTIVDHTERVEAGSFVEGAESFVPVIRWLNQSSDSDKRLCWRRMVGDSTKKKQNDDDDDDGTTQSPYLSLWAPVVKNEDDGDDSDELKMKKIQKILQALHEVDRAIAEEAKVAPRFTLRKGQAMVVDNFRMLHAREPFMGHESRRRMWRVWSWTTQSFGLPPQFITNTDSTSDPADAVLTGSDEASTARIPSGRIAANVCASSFLTIVGGSCKRLSFCSFIFLHSLLERLSH